MNKSIFKYIAIGTMGVATATSCTDYLDKEPESDVSKETAFLNFNNFQGFVEEIYNCIPTKESNMWCTTFNWGEDEIMNTGLGDSHVTAQFDLGNYRNWYQNNQSYLHADNPDPTSKDKYAHSIEHAWYCIRKANIGLNNMDLLLDATKNERNAIEGQLYFFRAWWHEEQMIWMGGIPYIDQELDPNESYTLPRLSFAECADKAYDDFKKAADLLPANWDAANIGEKGMNGARISKATALAYAGKVMLWAASPLNNIGQGETGGKNTYNYNTERAKKAAEALGQAITLIEQGSTPFVLGDFAYEEVTDWEKERGIYDHKVAKTASATNFTNIFYTTGKNWAQPGGTASSGFETMLQNPYIGNNGSNWNFAKLWGTKISSIVEHDAVIHQPTANYVNYAYGMANGEPAYIVKNGELVINEASGFDPSHPFKDRDPRFYHDIVFDGFRYINGDPDKDKKFQYCEMFTGGNIRDNANGSRTGYYCQKLVPHQANKYDGAYNWGDALQCNLPYMRVADVYLLYAEACAAAGGATYKASSCALSSVDAINKLRDRVGAGHVADAYLSGNAYMDEVRRERACELAFEGHRWNDLQRWLLLTEKPYTIKTSQEFTRVGNYDFVKNDPAEAEVTGWSEKVIVERNYTAKHYLLPFKNSDVTIYDTFLQNPGW
ncbi:MAG: RagB/SusD family nutrient uptake outer membrane protein [Bacteroidales bacterium]|nr:RagB/SusD family nutrient uptake outer membrane protein [Bacteroidales bacterium]